MNYAILCEEILRKEKEAGRKPRILLQACCAPCSSVVLERLSQVCGLTLYYYNPNTMPREEYEKRLGEFEKLQRFPFDLMEGAWDNDLFREKVRGLENEPEGGARCAVCIRLRLEETGRLAAEKGFDYFGTTLTVGPRKDPVLVNGVGEAVSRACGVPWFYADFKKKDGFRRSVALCRELGIYRQDYCGCRLGAEPEREGNETC
ncbi:MAG: epoxyqueuosine reductase QueH [Oscillospiraceae bacterium]|nr:epoxyqueuosine reductase QueH [Oscillospiraceae bacterium]